MEDGLTHRLTAASSDPKLKEMGTICTAIAMAFNGYRPNGGMEIFEFMNQLFGFNIIYQIDTRGRTPVCREKERCKVQHDADSGADEVLDWVYRIDTWSGQGDNTECWIVIVRGSYDLMRRTQE